MSECRVLSGKDCIITCKFGMRTHPVTGAYKLHNGVDVVGEGYSLAYITAHTEGIVEFAGYNSALGYHVNIRLATCRAGFKLKSAILWSKSKSSGLWEAPGFLQAHTCILGFRAGACGLTRLHISTRTIWRTL